ncbi:hypothetical protein NIES932_25950 [Raphidiopsis curvata NIES-932]|nr:hypothetical protein NIES932_25950 [Raphidiopsis curvata NIES-932]
MAKAIWLLYYYIIIVLDYALFITLLSVLYESYYPS